MIPSRSKKKIEVQKDFCWKIVFALANIELVRVDGSHCFQMKLNGVF